MDPLSGAASVIAVLTITGKIISECTKYGKAVRDAPDDIKRLETTIEGVESVLKGVQKLLNRSDAQKRLAVSNSVSKPLVECSTQLKKVSDKLETTKPTGLRKFWGRSLKWPFQSKELDEIISAVESYVQIFSAALQVDQTEMLSNVDRNMDTFVFLDRLPAASEAIFDSYDDGVNKTCLDQTRVELRRQLQTWAAAPDSKCIYWLKGVAGTGKSTIARTMAQYFKDQGVLGATFFFKRGAGDSSNARRFFTTVARQLSKQYPALKECITDAVRVEPDLASKALKEQFEKFLLDPFSSDHVAQPLPQVVLLVIDALDECEREEDIKTLIHLFSRCKDTKTKLRVLMTSRPELPIRLGFERLSKAEYDDLVLQDIPKDVIESDLELFLQHEFNNVRLEHRVAVGWPKEDEIKQLARLATPLFIFAATVCRSVNYSGRKPEEQLKYILESANQSQASGMNNVYLPILQQLIEKIEDDHELVLLEFRQIVGAIVLLADPLSAIALANLLSLEKSDIEFRLRGLHSVLDIPHDLSRPIRTHHLSFRDFLLDAQKRSGPFWIDEGVTHLGLAHHGLRLLNKPGSLKQDMCNLKRPWTRRKDIDQKHIEKALPPEILYACRYWVHHVKESTTSTRTEPIDIDLIWAFLQRGFLFWLEALTLAGYSVESVRMMDTLLSISEITAREDLASFIMDAKRFILFTRPGFEERPLQLYSSALMFAPENSIVRKTFVELMPKWIRLLPRIQSDWSPCLQTLEGHYNSVGIVAWSTTGMLATAGGDVEGRDSKIMIWDPTTGEVHNTLGGQGGRVSAIAFSNNGFKLASVSRDDEDASIFRVWDVATGACSTLIVDRPAEVVKFSLDGRTAAFFTHHDLYCEIKIWDTTTGGIRTITTTESLPYKMALSPEGHAVAGIFNNTISIWDTVTGKLHRILRSQASFVNAVVVFSPAGSLMATSSYKKNELWDIETGLLRTTLDIGHTFPYAITFTPNGQLVVVGDGGGVIQLWSVASGTLLGELSGHTLPVLALSFQPHEHDLSPDRFTLASGSVDETVRLWEIPMSLEKRSHAMSVAIPWGKRVRFSLDGQSAITYRLGPDYDRGGGLWDAMSGVLLKSLDNIRLSQYGESARGDQTLLIEDRAFLTESRNIDAEFHSGAALHQRDHSRYDAATILWKKKSFLWVPPEYRTDEMD